MSEQLRLAAILVADVVGYSRLSVVRREGAERWLDGLRLAGVPV